MNLLFIEMVRLDKRSQINLDKRSQIDLGKRSQIDLGKRSQIDLGKRSNINLDKRSDINLGKRPRRSPLGRNLPLPAIDEPRSNLVPRWGNFHSTSGDPVDPRDCGAYPESPWCGGNPLDFSPIAIEPSIVRSKCAIGIQLQGVVGFMKLPAQQFVYINPNCRDRDQVTWPPKKNPGDRLTPPPPMPPPGWPSNTPIFVTVNSGASNSTQAEFTPNCRRGYESSSGSVSQIRTITGCGVDEFGRRGYTIEVESTAAGSGTCSPYDGTPPYTIYTQDDSNKSSSLVIPQIQGFNNTYRTPDGRRFTVRQGVGWYQGNSDDIIEMFGQTTSDLGWHTSNSFSYPGSVYKADSCEQIDIGGGKKKRRDNPPPTRRRRRRRRRDEEEEEEMSCNCAINKEILKELQRVSAVLNVQGMLGGGISLPSALSGEKKPPPIQVTNYSQLPTWGIKMLSDVAGQWVQKVTVVEGEEEVEYTFRNIGELLTTLFAFTHEGNKGSAGLAKAFDIDGLIENGIILPERLTWKDGQEPGEITLENYAQLIEWWIQSFSDIMGQYETAITIPDANPTEAGDQELELKFENMSELLSEMFMLVFDSHINSQLLVQGQMRHSQLTFQGNLGTLKSYYMIKSLLGWAGVETRGRQEKVDTPFAMDGETVSDFYEEGQVAVNVNEYAGKAKDTVGYKLAQYDQACDIIHQIYTTKLSSKKDMKGQLAGWLLDHAKSIKDLIGAGADLDQFIKDFEANFTEDIPENKEWKAGQGFGVKVKRHKK